MAYESWLAEMARSEMFRDEGTEPSVEFNRRMRERVERTPTELLVIVMPFLAIARVVLIAHSLYMRSRRETLSRQINTNHDLRSRFASHLSATNDRQAINLGRQSIDLAGRT